METKKIILKRGREMCYSSMSKACRRSGHLGSIGQNGARNGSDEAINTAAKAMAIADRVVGETDHDLPCFN